MGKYFLAVITSNATYVLRAKTRRTCLTLGNIKGPVPVVSYTIIEKLLSTYWLVIHLTSNELHVEFLYVTVILSGKLLMGNIRF